MVSILVFGIILLLGYFYYRWDYCKRVKKVNTPANIKLRVSKEFQDLVLGSSCKFRFRLGDNGKTFYRMKCFNPTDDDDTIIIVLDKVFDEK